ncbi:ABC transporter substrate-binding protein [Buchananella hordeovulneris]|uniref:ABC transporter substrate-binding protein n=1 Tax=Buchananella hordeovulneris TaxID=52770 RepID=A0A1Q5PX10_9ACTO|nr:extracellular solute-binding protein [Buchananella hordeovulneris]MDO5080999.1 extracellular solute-binding protein [Buchananella hordeovulneris]OKL52036.1 ABC transporter substrate-binding protein [Buchananella hordeovulneris]RRD45032.1 extracellular solute-binding protein [Buchananella hordeovulneris]
MSTRWSKAALALALPLSLALTACGGSGGDQQGGGDGGGKGGDANTLTVWTWDPAFNIYAMQEAEKIYQKDHPDFKLEIKEVPWDDVQAKLTTLAQSQQYDELPDIFLMQNNAFQKNVINYPDVFADMKDAGIDYSQFPQSIVDYSTVDGVNYGVPFDSGTAITALRTDMLEQAGFTIKDFTDITWDEFIEKGKVVKEKTGKPMFATTTGTSDTIMMMLQSAGGSLFDDKGNPTIAKNEILLKAADVYKRLADSGVMMQVNSWDELVSSFVNEGAVGTINGVWISGSIQTAKDQSGKWAVTNVPSLPGVEGATNYTANGGSSWAISSTANVELAQDFLKSTFAGSSELYDTILPTSGAVANWIPAGQSKVYLEPQEFFGGQAIYADVVKYGEKVPSNNTGVYYYEGRDAVSAALTKIINGEDPAKAFEEAQATVEFAMK